VADLSGIGATVIVVGGGGPGADEVPSQRLVRVWERDWTFLLQLPGTSVETNGEVFTATLPLEHELPTRLLDDTRPKDIRLTVDDGALRWAGVLQEYQVIKVGDARIMKIHWITPQPPQLVGTVL
jgi:hypothetical protein